MRAIAAFVVLGVLLCGSLWASSKGGHVLYYLDRDHNVRRIALDRGGKALGQASRITKLGGYDTYSVSPDGKWVAGIKHVGEGDMKGYRWKCYLEHVGGRPIGPVFGTVDSDGEPRTEWSPQGKYMISWGGQVMGTTRVCNLATGKQTLITDECVGEFSADEKYAFVIEDVGCVAEGPGDVWVADLETGKLRRLAAAQFENEDCVWVGNTHSCAVIDTRGNVWVAGVTSSASGVMLNKRALTRNGHCSDLRYVKDRGLYFVQESAGRKRAYYCRDMKTLVPGELLPAVVSKSEPRSSFEGLDKWHLPTGAWEQCAEVSPDGAFVACPVSAGGPMPVIKVFTESGATATVGPGKLPQWKGGGFGSFAFSSLLYQ